MTFLAFQSVAMLEVTTNLDRNVTIELFFKGRVLACSALVCIKLIYTPSVRKSIVHTPPPLFGDNSK